MCGNACRLAQSSRDQNDPIGSVLVKVGIWNRNPCGRDKGECGISMIRYVTLRAEAILVMTGAEVDVRPPFSPPGKPHTRRALWAAAWERVVPQKLPCSIGRLPITYLLLLM